MTVAAESLPLGETNLSKLFEALILSGYFRGRKLVQDHNLCYHEDQGQGTSAESPSSSSLGQCVATVPSRSDGDGEGLQRRSSFTSFILGDSVKCVIMF